MLQVGARITGAALSLASPAKSLNPACSMSSVSQVAPSAVAEGRHFAGVLMKKWFPLIPVYCLVLGEYDETIHLPLGPSLTWG